MLFRGLISIKSFVHSIWIIFFVLIFLLDLIFFYTKTFHKLHFKDIWILFLVIKMFSNFSEEMILKWWKEWARENPFRDRKVCTIFPSTQIYWISYSVFFLLFVIDIELNMLSFSVWWMNELVCVHLRRGSELRNLCVQVTLQLC